MKAAPDSNTDPTWRPPGRQEDEVAVESGTFLIQAERFESMRMPRQSIEPRGARLTPVRTRVSPIHRR